jgi:hypothetical protein
MPPVVQIEVQDRTRGGDNMKTEETTMMQPETLLQVLTRPDVGGYETDRQTARRLARELRGKVKMVPRPGGRVLLVLRAHHD